MTRYRGGLNKGDVIRANAIIKQKAVEKQRVKLLKAAPPPRKDERKAQMACKKEMVHRYTLVFGNSTHQCIYCGKWVKAYTANYTMEHLVPLSGGGSDHPANHHPACLSCNHDKDQLTLEEWLNVLRRRYDESPGLNAPLVYIIMRVEFWLIFVHNNKDKLFNK